MKKTQLKILVIVLIMIAATNVMNGQPYVISDLPQCPPNTNPTTTADSVVFSLDVPGIAYNYPGNNFNVTIPDLTHGGFTGSITPPVTIGNSVTQNIGASISAVLQGSVASAAVFSPGPFTVKMTKISGSAPDEGVFETEILALDMSGGNLPPGVQIRESPTLVSTGQTTITKVNGKYRISSGFNLNTELTVDGGQTWMPQTSPPAHVFLRYYHFVPTIGQWGLIIFSLLLLAIGMVLVYRRQNALVLAGNVTQDQKSSLFDRGLFFKVLGIVLLITVIGIFAANWYFNGISNIDKLGTMVSAGIVAYMVQLFMLMRKK